MSVWRAVLIGFVVVNVPVLMGLLGPALIFIYLGHESFTAWTVAGAVAGFVAAWVWWSISVPKWRLWAYQRVDNIPALKRSATDFQIIWPDGSFFERTEIKSKQHAEEERALERAKSRK